MIDKNAIFTLISEAEQRYEIKILDDMIDRLHRQNKIQMRPDDWKHLAQIEIAATKRILEANQK